MMNALIAFTFLPGLFGYPSHAQAFQACMDWVESGPKFSQDYTTPEARKYYDDNIEEYNRVLDEIANPGPNFDSLMVTYREVFVDEFEMYTRPKFRKGENLRFCRHELDTKQYLGYSREDSLEATARISRHFRY